jgi:hypothetical protein
MTDVKLQQLYDNFLEFADHMCAEHGPMEVAAIMMTQALTIYKSALSEDDYNRMVDNMSANRDKVKKFERSVLQ